MAAQRKANAAAKSLEALTTALKPDPVQINAKARKRCVVPPPGNKRKQIAPKKAVLAKARWESPEEVDGGQVDEMTKRTREKVVWKTTTTWCHMTCQRMITLQTERISLLEISRKQWPSQDNVVLRS